MATRKYDSFRELKKGKYDWEVTARIMNLWRGYTTKGEPFKPFNLLLLDNKRCRIHAFVPANIADGMEPMLVVGNLYLFKNFTVREYKAEDKFRCLHKDIQIVFSNDTKVVHLEENDVFIEHVMFDFFDLSDLKALSKQTTYLTDVIGVIKTTNPTLGQVNNRHGLQQSQIKFEITDGSTTVKVTFWDAFAELFAEALQGDFEYPLIIIIGSGRVTEWKDKVDISNVAATTFYLNYNHYSVTQMRKMLKEPLFADLHLSTKKVGPLKVYTVEEIKQLGADDIESVVLCQVKVKHVPETETWFNCFCTSCYNQVAIVNKDYLCTNCKRVVPHPQKWFQLYIIACDETGSIDILLENLPVRKFVGKTVTELLKEHKDNFPNILKTIEDKEYTIKLLITICNIQQKNTVYLGKDIMEGKYLEAYNEESEQTQPKPLQESYAEASASTYHLESMSVNN